MVGESKKRSKTSSSSSAVAPTPVKLSKEEIFNVSGVFVIFMNLCL